MSAKTFDLTAMVLVAYFPPIENTFNVRSRFSNPTLDGHLLLDLDSFFAPNILFNNLQLAPMAFLNFMVTSDSLRSVLLSVWISMA